MLLRMTPLISFLPVSSHLFSLQGGRSSPKASFGLVDHIQVLFWHDQMKIAKDLVIFYETFAGLILEILRLEQNYGIY